MKTRTMVIALALIMGSLLGACIGSIVFDSVKSDVLSITHNPVAGDPRFPAQITENNADIENIVNGLIDSFNIENNTLKNDDMLCTASTNYCGIMTSCDAAVDNADALHSHDADSITYSTTGYSATNVLDAITDVGDYVGYSASTAATTTSLLQYIGVAHDYSNEYPANATTSISITVATDTASIGIIANIMAEFEGVGDVGKTCNLAVPLSINGTPLSTNASHNARFVIECGGSGAASMCHFSGDIIYRTVDGWLGGVANTVEIGPTYDRADSTDCGGTTVKQYQLILYGLR